MSTPNFVVAEVQRTTDVVVALERTPWEWVIGVDAFGIYGVNTSLGRITGFKGAFLAVITDFVIDGGLTSGA